MSPTTLPSRLGPAGGLLDGGLRGLATGVAGTLAVGAPLENYDATGVGGTPTSAAFNSGAVFLY